MIRYVKGDIFDSTAEILVNPVNCVGVSGAGLAKEFRMRYPRMYEGYQKACESESLRPGRLFVYMAERIILCFPTKDHWKDASKLEYIDDSLKELAKFLKVHDKVTVALPALGCGLGGLDWADVKPLIEKHLGGLDCDIEVYEPL